MKLLPKRRKPTLRERAGEIPGTVERLATIALERSKPLVEEAARSVEEAAERAKPALDRARKEAEKRTEVARKEARKRGKTARKEIERRTKAARERIDPALERLPGRQRPSRLERARTPLVLVGAAAAGGALVYFLDPVQGKARRTKAKDRTAKMLRKTARATGTLGTRVANRTKGVTREAVPTDGETDMNDPTLAHKVESEILGDPEFPKGRVNVSAENGTIVLKGELDDAEQIKRLEQAVRRVEGVQDVENLIVTGS